MILIKEMVNISYVIILFFFILYIYNLMFLLDFSIIGDPKFQEEDEFDNSNSNLLEVGQVFDNYVIAERFLNQYTKSNRFVVIKG